MGKIVGIDLGTTNSCVAIAEGTTARVLSTRSGSRTTPSVVAITEDGERLVGHIGKRQAITNPQHTIFAVKRLMGRKYDSPEVQHWIESYLPYGLTEASNGDVMVQVWDSVYSPPEISSMLLRELKECAEEALGEEVTEAIITVPAYFDDSERQATKDAGRIAGLEVRRILNEPTAAALAYGLEKSGETRNIAVFDLGGGTFDISILEISDGLFSVRSTNGDATLGGEDFDTRIMDWLIAKFLEETQIDLATDRMALQRLKEAAERAKAELSTETEATISLPFISADENGPRHLSYELTRTEFEGLVADLVERTVAPCEDALREAELKTSDIDEVLLVGGQTRTPMVIASVERVFGKKPSQELNPDEVVAVGAAIQAGILQGTITDVVLLDVTPLSLGIETQGGLCTRIIERNSTIPTKSTQIFTTVVDNQDTVKIRVLQGERNLASENRFLGEVELVGIPPTAKGVPQIEVTFSIDSNSIHTVSAHDVATGRSQSLQINPASGLEAGEVERLIREASQFAEEDDRRRQIRQLRNRLEGLIQNSQKVFDQFAAMLNSAEHSKIQGVLRRAGNTLRSDSRVDLEEAMFDLNSVAATLSTVMLDAKEEDA